LANPSRASYKARVGRYYRAVELTYARSASLTITAERRARALAREPVKLDEVLAYLARARDPGESETVASVAQA
jgi:hypothetical protein